MTQSLVTVQTGANIAFIKYWGNRGGELNLPLNPSLSMTLAACVTRTSVAIHDAPADDVVLDGRPAEGTSRLRVIRFLDAVRALARRTERLRVVSHNSFPRGAGIASSASGFAALALAASRALGLRLDDAALSRLARRGSGSAARSVFGGFSELHPAEDDAGAFAEQIASEAHWPELRDIVVLVSREEKRVSSADGHGLAATSEMCAGRLRAVPCRADRVRRAILDRDLAALGEAAEADALSMHAVMMTSRPPLLYWAPKTLEVIRCAWTLRDEGVPVWFTIDAGPNVHLLTLSDHAGTVLKAVRRDTGAEALTDGPGPGARVVEDAAL